MNDLGDFYSSIKIGQRIIKQEQRFKSICILQIQFTKSCPFLSAFQSYAEKEPAA
jgi:hypothetical protein